MARADGQDDQDLLERFRLGDERAFRVLTERHRGVLEARIRDALPRGLRRRVDAQDVLQEALLVAFRRREEFENRGEPAFRHWLLAIVELKAREHVRHHRQTAKRSTRREVTRSGRRDTGLFPAAQASPSQVAIGLETGRLAREALTELSEDYREVLRLTREQRMSLRDAADCMGRTHEATKKLYGRALARFWEAFNRLRGDHA